jgi:membrane-associated phospholipid phosphatase
MHGLGVAERVAGAVPEALVPLLAALTALGDPALLSAAVALAYWHGPARILDSFADGMRLVAAALAGMAGVATLKPVVAHARPPAAVANVATDGFALPSGHTTGAAAVLVGGALLCTAATRRRRLALAAVGVAVVSFTRVALGVHYLLDTVAGATLGAGLALAVVGLTRERVAPGLALAALVGAVGFWLTGASDPLAVGGVATGALLGWVTTENRVRPSLPRTLAGFACVGALLGAVLALSLPAPATAISSVVGGAVLSGLPAQNFSR